jgi:heme/copper-type cytochrome/quinol oxidase subunit 1
MIFPRLNALSFWLLFFSLLLGILSSQINGGIACGWTFYVPLCILEGIQMDLFIFSLHMAGLSSILGSINFICTIHAFTYTKDPLI